MFHGLFFLSVLYDRMVCNFIGTIPPLRAVDSPRFAARFVSLLPFYHRSDLLGGLSNENFQSPFVTCMCKQGDVVAHSLLLCALLLGLVCCIILLHILWHPGYLPISPYYTTVLTVFNVLLCLILV